MLGPLLDFRACDTDAEEVGVGGRGFAWMERACSLNISTTSRGFVERMISY